MKRIGIIDADLLIRSTHRKDMSKTELLYDKEGHIRAKGSDHRFPNLACMKISGYHKHLGDSVELLMDYSTIGAYDLVYISKVFTDTPIPDFVYRLLNVKLGGTGFFFDKAPALPCEIEHHMPDYHLYDKWVANRIAESKDKEKTKTAYKEYTDYSIGYLTRGCFRKCSFCVNQNYDRVTPASPLAEFYDPDRPCIALLDDNFLGQPDWKKMLDALKATGKKFKFKQGLDERLLTDEKMEALLSSRYDGDITFAFDRIEDYAMIEEKLRLIRRHTHRAYQFYLLVGYDAAGVYDDDFWEKDIREAFIRMELLMRYGCYPYVMRFQACRDSEYEGMYTNLARYCNTPTCRPVKKLSFRQWLNHPDNAGAPNRHWKKFKDAFPEFEKENAWLLDTTFTKRGGYIEEFEQLTFFPVA